MKKIKLIIAAAMLFFSVSIFAQSGKTYWRAVTTVKNKSSVIAPDKKSLNKLKLYELDIQAIKADLASAPKRSVKNNSATVINFPNPDGSFGSYLVTENSVMDPVLQAKYPDIRSYVGKGIEDPTAIIYFSVSPGGVKTMLIKAGQPVSLIEPYTKDLSTYVVYNKGDRSKSLTPFECKLKETTSKKLNRGGNANRPNADDGVLRTYRLALACNGEYAQYFGGTVAGAMGGFNATLTRLNGIFETDFGVHMSLIANTDLLIYLNPATDPFSDGAAGAAGAWNAEIETTLTNVIGSANYDVGHLLCFTGGGGNAGCLSCVCKDPFAGDNGQNKGRGFTSGASDTAPPEGDEFDLDFCGHEFGHQFGGAHVFSYEIQGGGAQVEPGSGSSIMSYAGVTGPYDVQPHNDAYFNARNIEQITNYIKTTTCQVNTNTNNAIPTASAGPDYTIPHGTAFTLTGTGTDANADALTFNWEEQDEEVTLSPFPTTTDTDGPQFRSFPPVSVPSRTFPKLATVLTGATASQWEVVPDVERVMNFRFTVRDNHAGGPANNSDDMVVTTAASGPFVVTVPNTAVSWKGNTSQNVTWDVAGTTGAPVSAANVKVSLSTDGGLTFPTVLLASTPNDGSESITVPNINTTTARIKVEALGNIFFDISNVDFTITAAAATFNIVATSGANGSVTPAGTTNVTSGNNQTYTITANSCYAIADVLVDGVSVGAVGTYTFTNVTATHTISASFTQLSYNITATSGANGTVTPSGSSAVSCGTNKTYTIAANSCYAIADVLVDGVSVGAVGTYTFTGVTGPHTISATFVRWTYTITATSGANGTVTPAGATAVNCGTNQTYTISPASGFAVQQVLVDGATQGAITTYTFTGVTATHTISATFVAVSGCTAPTLSAAVTNVSCKGTGTGAINLTATGGTAPYTYAWSKPGFSATTEDLTGLTAGTYTVVVTATGGCTKSASYVVAEPSAILTATFTAGTISCFNGTTSVVVSAAGGTAPYTGTGTIANQAAGNHSYTVTDANGCSVTSAVMKINQPAPVSVTATAGTLNCSGTTSVVVSATGGTAPYTGTGTFTNQAPGGHTYVVTDALGCTASRGIYIAQGAPSSTLSATATPGAISCNGGTTSVVVSATGGTAPYTGTGTIANQTAGTKTFTVSDAAGCTTTVTVTITQPAKLAVTAVPGTINCFGGTTSVVVSATGGTAPYTGTGTITNQASGNNTYTVTDSKGCTASVTVKVNQPAPISVTATAGTISCNGGTTSVTISATGGTAPYTGTGTLTGQAAGPHTYVVTDSKGCSFSRGIYIANGTGTCPPVSPKYGGAVITLNANLRVQPNPVQSIVLVTFTAAKHNSKYAVTVSDMRGRTLASVTGLTITGINKQEINMGRYANGMYFITLLMDNKKLTQKVLKNN